MNSRDLTADQITRTRDRIRPMREYHYKLLRRAIDVNLMPLELANSIQRASNEMEDLNRELIRLISRRY